MWTTINESDVKAALNSAELEACRAQIADGDEDPLAGVVADTIEEVRGYVRASSHVTADGIPHSLKNACLDLIVYRLLKRLKVEPDEQRKGAGDAAVRLLERVADGDFGVEDPDDEQVSAETVLGPTATERTLYFDRDTQDGL